MTKRRRHHLSHHDTAAPAVRQRTLQPRRSTGCWTVVLVRRSSSSSNTPQARHELLFVCLGCGGWIARRLSTSSTGTTLKHGRQDRDESREKTKLASFVACLCEFFLVRTTTMMTAQRTEAAGSRALPHKPRWRSRRGGYSRLPLMPSGGHHHDDRSVALRRSPLSSVDLQQLEPQAAARHTYRNRMQFFCLGQSAGPF